MGKALAMTLVIFGMGGLIVGVMGIFGKNMVNLSPWPFAILGLIFFFCWHRTVKKDFLTSSVAMLFSDELLAAFSI